MNKFDLVKFAKFWLPVYLYAGLIFLYSSFSRPPVPFKFMHQDKLLHFVEYAILGYLVARAARHSSREWLKTHFRFCAVVFAFAYGLSDEFHQYLVPARHVEFLDVVMDAFGGFIGQLFFRG